MGIAVVAFLESRPGDQGPMGQQLVEELSSRLECLGAEKEAGQLCIDMEVYAPVSANPQQPARPLHVVTSSESPASAYVVPEPSAGAGVCVSADSMITLLLNQLRSQYQPKPAQAAHCRGPKFSLGDFTVRLGTLVFGQAHSVKGVVVEAEYRACSRMHQGWQLLREFFTNVFPDCAPALDPPNDIVQRLAHQHAGVEYAYPITVQQYLLHAYQLGARTRHRGPGTHPPPPAAQQLHHPQLAQPGHVQHPHMQPAGHMPPGHLPPGHLPPGHLPQPGHMPQPAGHLPPGHMPQPGHMQPGHMQPSHMQPSHMQPGHMQPGHMQPDHVPPQAWARGPPSIGR